MGRCLNDWRPMMKVLVQFQNGDERTYEQAHSVKEKDTYLIYIYGENNQILAILNKGDITNLFTNEKSE